MLKYAISAVLAMFQRVKLRSKPGMKEPKSTVKFNEFYEFIWSMKWVWVWHEFELSMMSMRCSWKRVSVAAKLHWLQEKTARRDSERLKELQRWETEKSLTQKKVCWLRIVVQSPGGCTWQRNHAGQRCGSGECCSGCASGPSHWVCLGPWCSWGMSSNASGRWHCAHSCRLWQARCKLAEAVAGLQGTSRGSLHDGGLLGGSSQGPTPGKMQSIGPAQPWMSAGYDQQEGHQKMPLQILTVGPVKIATPPWLTKTDGTSDKPRAAFCCSALKRWSNARRISSRSGMVTDRRKWSSGVAADGLDLIVCRTQTRDVDGSTPTFSAISRASFHQSLW